MIGAEPAHGSVFAAHSRGGPTVLRLLLGGQLRRLREERGITRAQAAQRIRGSESKISRMELGRVACKERDVADLLALFGVTDDQERDGLLSLTRQANTPGWWHKYSDILPGWFELYVGLEEAAVLVRNYEVQFVPGLLQTPEYARAVTLLGHGGATEEEIGRRIDLRMRRQRRLTAPDAPAFWALVDEAVLRRPLGGTRVMRAQLAHLLEMAALPNVTVQVLPFDRGGHPAAGGPFSILRFAERDLPDVVYLEQLTSALYLDDPAEVERYLAVMDQLCVEAASAEESIAMLRQVAKEL